MCTKSQFPKFFLGMVYTMGNFPEYLFATPEYSLTTPCVSDKACVKHVQLILVATLGRKISYAAYLRISKKMKKILQNYMI